MAGGASQSSNPRNGAGARLNGGGVGGGSLNLPAPKVSPAGEESPASATQTPPAAAPDPASAPASPPASSLSTNVTAPTNIHVSIEVSTQSSPTPSSAGSDASPPSAGEVQALEAKDPAAPTADHTSPSPTPAAPTVDPKVDPKMDPKGELKVDLESLRKTNPIELAPGLTVQLGMGTYLIKSTSGDNSIAIQLGFSPSPGKSGDEKLITQLKKALSPDTAWSSFDAARPLDHPSFRALLNDHARKISISGYSDHFGPGSSVKIDAREVNLEQCAISGCELSIKADKLTLDKNLSIANSSLELFAKEGLVGNGCSIARDVVLRGDLGKMEIDGGATFAPCAPTAYLSNVIFRDITSAKPTDLEQALAAFEKRNAGFAYHQSLAPTIIQKTAQLVSDEVYAKYLSETFKQPATPPLAFARETVTSDFVRKTVTAQYITDSKLREKAIRHMLQAARDEVRAREDRERAAATAPKAAAAVAPQVDTAAIAASTATTAEPAPTAVTLNEAPTVAEQPTAKEQTLAPTTGGVAVTGLNHIGDGGIGDGDSAIVDEPIAREAEAAAGSRTLERVAGTSSAVSRSFFRRPAVQAFSTLGIMAGVAVWLASIRGGNSKVENQSSKEPSPATLVTGTPPSSESKPATPQTTSVADQASTEAAPSNTAGATAAATTATQESNNPLADLSGPAIERPAAASSPELARSPESELTASPGSSAPEAPPEPAPVSKQPTPPVTTPLNTPATAPASVDVTRFVDPRLLEAARNSSGGAAASTNAGASSWAQDVSRFVPEHLKQQPK